MINPLQMHRVMPHCGLVKCTYYLSPLGGMAKAIHQYQIGDSLHRIAAFLAQVAHESGELQYWRELDSGSAYEGRRDLGNVYPGDGPRFKGRSPLQITGRSNYAEYGKALGVNLIADPDLIARDPRVGWMVSCRFWWKNGLNDLADNGDFRGITHRINGGYNGLADREMYYARALHVLGA